MFEIKKLKNIKKNGNLYVGEGNKILPIKVKRFYFLTNLKKNFWRGFHSHKNLNQLMVSINGKFEFLLKYKKKTKKIILKKGHSFILPKNTWREFRSLSANATLLVLCDKKFSRKDYIYTNNE